VIERIAVVLIAGIGDFFLAVPALKALRRKYPQAKIWLASSQKAAAYARGCGAVDHVVAFPEPAGMASWPALARAALELRSFKPDAAVNFYEIGTRRGDARMKLLFRFMAAKQSYGRRTPLFGAYFDKYVTEDPGDTRTQADYYAALCEMLGAPLGPVLPDWLWTGEYAERAAVEFLAARLGHGPLVGINPASARKSRHWQPERFAEVADRLVREKGAEIVILGGPSDIALARQVAVRMASNPLVAAGRFPLEGTLALVKRLDLLVTVHSALMHAANIMEVPFVCLSGPGNMVKDGPYGGDPARRVIVPPGASCAPCEREDCADMSCMKGISADSVYEAAARLLPGGKT